MNAFRSSCRTYLIKSFQGGGSYEGGTSVVQRLEARVDGGKEPLSGITNDKIEQL